MRILITGAKGQLGMALQSTLTEHHLIPTDLPEFDIVERRNVFALFEEARPELVIHCAAYTNVDGCARDPELAHRVNTLGTQNIALACQKADAPMVHISTNEVFSGDDPAGYEEWMTLSPRNPYGRSKAAAEVAVQTLLNRYYIVRTAWLYSAGGRNFIHAILRAAREKGAIRVVTDEVGNPTNAADLAEAIGRLIATEHYGIYHFVNSGACSRWAFANEILRLAGMEHVINTPILGSEFTRLSWPPPFCALHNRNGAAIGIALRSWQEALADLFQDGVEA
ncbi:MAG: dTDP-4-dehydrorhamnose reductase [Anaerolineae bacterium]|nr:dTDP-4-dehydrorhamnose reductase [Anaerolineae bacterium]